MKRQLLRISSCGASVLVRSNNPEDIEKLIKSDFLYRYIPEIKIDQLGNKTDATLDLKRGASRIMLKYPRAEYRNKSVDVNDVLSLAEYLLERARQSRGYYCMHGAAVEVRGKAIIFWGGASGMGKTALAKYFSKQADCIWFSDEKVVIDLKHSTVVGGVGSAYFNKGEKNVYDKLALRKKMELPIAMFVYPFVTSVPNKLTWDRWTSEKFDWHLFEEMNRKIRGTSRRVFSNIEPLPPLDDMTLARKRNALIGNMAKRMPCYYAQGEAKAIAAAIRNNI